MSVIDYYLFTNIVLILEIVIRADQKRLHFKLPEKLGQGDAVVAAEAVERGDREVGKFGFDITDVHTRLAGHWLLEQPGLLADHLQFLSNLMDSFVISVVLRHFALCL